MCPAIQPSERGNTRADRGRSQDLKRGTKVRGRAKHRLRCAYLNCHTREYPTTKIPIVRIPARPAKDQANRVAPAIRASLLARTDRSMPISLVIFVGVLSAIIALRPLGFDRDFREYGLFYFGAVERGSRMEWTAFGISWRLLESAGVTFFATIALTTFVALLPKFQTAWILPTPWLWILTYTTIFLPLHEYTQIRLAFAVGMAMMYINRCIRLGRADGRAFAFATLAAWIHPSLLPLVPAAFGWRWFGAHPYAFLCVCVAPAALPSHALMGVISGLHTEYEFAELAAGTNSTGFNTLSLRNIVIAISLTISASQIHRLPQVIRPLVGIASGYFALGVSMPQEPVFAHRMVEIAMLFPPLWVSWLTLLGRTFVSIAYCILCATVFYLLAVSSDFFGGADIPQM